MPRIRILGSGREVGRAAVLVEHDGSSALLDYGVSFNERDEPVFPGHVRPRDLEAVVLTHSHLDHIGAAPSLYVSVKPRLYATPVTIDVSRLLLYDMIKLNGAHLPYDEAVVDEMLSSATPVNPGDRVEAGRLSLEFIHSGHIPGSVSVVVEAGGSRVLYTSDINVIETKLVWPAEVEGVEADTVIIESTYGATVHPPRREVEDRFYGSVREVVESGGIVLVPAFSVSRGQEILSLLAERGLDYPVWIDGMIRQVAEVYMAHKKSIYLPGLLAKALSEYRVVRGWQDRKRALKQPGVIVASAGMLKGGPSLYYMKRIAADDRNAVFMVSFQAPGTPGRMILEEGVFGEERIPVMARVEWFDFSSHIDQKGILELLRGVKGLERVILVHGEPPAQEVLASKIREELGVDVLIPANGETIEL